MPEGPATLPAPSRTQLLWDALSSAVGEETAHAILRVARWSARRDAPAEANLTADRWADERLFPGLLDHLPADEARELLEKTRAMFEAAPPRSALPSEAPTSMLRERVDAGREMESARLVQPRIETAKDLVVAAASEWPSPVGAPQLPAVLRPTLVSTGALQKTERATISPDVASGLIVWTWDHELIDRLRQRVPPENAILLVSDIGEFRAAFDESAAGSAPLIVLDRRWIRDGDPVELRPADLDGSNTVLWGVSPAASGPLHDALEATRRLIHCPSGAERDALVEICLGLLSSAR